MWQTDSFPERRMSAAFGNHGEKPMIELKDKDTGQALGAITEDQLQILVDALEEESSDDTDYYLNRTTLDALAANSSDKALIGLLERALGDREEMEIEWVRVGEE